MTKLSELNIRIEYPPEVEELIRQHHEMIARVYAEIDHATGVSDPAMRRASDLLVRPFDKESYIRQIEAAHEFKRVASEQLAKVLARYAPRTIIEAPPTA